MTSTSNFSLTLSQSFSNLGNNSNKHNTTGQVSKAVRGTTSPVQWKKPSFEKVVKVFGQPVSSQLKNEDAAPELHQERPPSQTTLLSAEKQPTDLKKTLLSEEEKREPVVE